jgi:hypothetical protein
MLQFGKTLNEFEREAAKNSVKRARREKKTLILGNIAISRFCW